jgi:hypothetical protein
MLKALLLKKLKKIPLKKKKKLMEENLLTRKHLKQLEPINLWEEEKCKEDLKNAVALG